MNQYQTNAQNNQQVQVLTIGRTFDNLTKIIDIKFNKVNKEHVN